MENKRAYAKSLVSLVGLIVFILMCVIIWHTNADAEMDAEVTSYRATIGTPPPSLEQWESRPIVLKKSFKTVIDGISAAKDKVAGYQFSLPAEQEETAGVVYVEEVSTSDVWVDTVTPADTAEAVSYDTQSAYSSGDLRNLGVIYWGGWRFTWYSEHVLAGGGLNIPGRWSDGDFVRDMDGYLCVASSDLAQGSIVETPWGTAKVYDCGCDSGTIDMYVSW